MKATPPMGICHSNEALALQPKVVTINGPLESSQLLVPSIYIEKDKSIGRKFDGAPSTTDHS